MLFRSVNAVILVISNKIRGFISREISNSCLIFPPSSLWKGFPRPGARAFWLYTSWIHKIYPWMVSFITYSIILKLHTHLSFILQKFENEKLLFSLYKTCIALSEVIINFHKQSVKIDKKTNMQYSCFISRLGNCYWSLISRQKNLLQLT